MRKNWIKLLKKVTDKGHKDLSVQMSDKGKIIEDTTSGDWRACRMAAPIIHDQRPHREKAHE